MERKDENAAASRVLKKLESAMESGNFYEAHQTYRTLYYRYLPQERKHDELLQLLFDGATKLLDAGQTTSGCDLALLFAEFLQRTSRPVDEKVLNKIESIFERLIRSSPSAKIRYDDESDEEEESDKPSSGAVDASSDRDAFVGKLIKWSKTVVPKFKNGHPVLHGRLASTWWRMKNYEQARYHFLLSNDGEGCASFLIEYHLAKGYPNEVDLFVAQAVFKLLCHKDKSTAETVFFHYTQHHPAISTKGVSTAAVPKYAIDANPPYSLPLLNFVWLLLLCIDTGRVTDFAVLVEKYQPSINRDPSYKDYLDRIGQLFFGLPPPTKKATGGMGGAFWKNLVTGLLGDDAENGDDGQSSSEETFQSVPTTPTRADSNGTKKTSKAQMESDDTLD